MRVIKERTITVGVYEYTFDSGDVLCTCGADPRACFDALHPNHENGGRDGNCYLNGELMSLSAAMNKLGLRNKDLL